MGEKLFWLCVLWCSWLNCCLVSQHPLRNCWFECRLLCFRSSSQLVYSTRQSEMAQVLGSLPDGVWDSWCWLGSALAVAGICGGCELANGVSLVFPLSYLLLFCLLDRRNCAVEDIYLRGVAKQDRGGLSISCSPTIC